MSAAPAGAPAPIPAGARPAPAQPPSPPGPAGPPRPGAAGRPGLAASVAAAQRWLLSEPPYALPAEGARRSRWGRFWLAHPRLLDLAPAVVVALLTIPAAVVTRHGRLFGPILAVALIVPLVWRRRAPLVTFALMVVVGLAQWADPSRPFGDEAFLVAVYTVAAYRTRRATATAFFMLEVGVVIASVRWSPAGSWVGSLVFLSAANSAAVLLGLTLRNRRAHLAALVERAERAEIERDQQAQMAAAAERTRIAREMHDIVAHSLAVMISLADGAGAKVRAEPDRAAEAIAGVATVGRQALDETRRLLGVLRAGPSPVPYAPQPSVGQLAELIDGMRDTGLPVRLVVTGDVRPVPAGMELTVYRIVQEALTNVLKHGRAVTAVAVTLEYAADGLALAVVDDGQLPPAGGWHDARPGGHGLLGMRERAGIYGGVVQAGPRRAGGWEVRVHLPHGVVPLAPAPA